MISITAVVITIPIITAYYSLRPIYLKIIFIFYLLFTIFIASHISYWTYMAVTMNSSAEIPVSNTQGNGIELHFVANQPGNYAIKLHVMDGNVLKEINDCTFGRMSDSRNKQAVKYCEENYGKKNITISINGVKKTSNGLFGIIFFAGSNQAVLNSFDAHQDKTYYIKVTFDKKMQKLLNAGSSITIQPSGLDAATLLYASICIYLPFILPAIFMLFYIRKKLKNSLNK